MEDLQNQLLTGNLTVYQYTTQIKGYRCWGQNAFDENIPYFDYQLWLHTVPIVVSLMINLWILLKIAKVVIEKISPNGSHYFSSLCLLCGCCRNGDAILGTFKATFKLVPMLGLIQFLTFYNFFGHGTDRQESISDVYFTTISNVLQSCQGLFISICYCFLNEEVKDSLKRRVSQRLSSVKPRLANESTPFQSYQ